MWKVKILRSGAVEKYLDENNFIESTLRVSMISMLAVLVVFKTEK